MYQQEEYYKLYSTTKKIFYTNTSWKYPSKHFLFSKTSPRHLEDVFSVKFFCLPRRHENFFKTSSRCVCKTPYKNFCKMSWRRLRDVFAIRLPKTSSRGLQNVFKTSSKTSSRHLQDAFKTCWQDVLEDVLNDKKMLHWKRVQHVLTKTNVCWDDMRRSFARKKIMEGCLKWIIHT